MIESFKIGIVLVVLATIIGIVMLFTFPYFIDIEIGKIAPAILGGCYAMMTVCFGAYSLRENQKERLRQEVLQKSLPLLEDALLFAEGKQAVSLEASCKQAVQLKASLMLAGSKESVLAFDKLAGVENPIEVYFQFITLLRREVGSSEICIDELRKACIATHRSPKRSKDES